MAGKGKGILRIAIEDFLETFPLGRIISGWFKQIGEDQEAAIVEAHPDVMDIIRKTPGLPKILTDLANYKPGDNLQGGIGTAAGMVFGLGQSAAGGVFEPVSRKLNQSANYLWPNEMPDLSLAFQLYYRDLISENTLDEIMQKIGWDDDYKRLFKELSISRVPIPEMLQLWLRKEIPEGELDLEMERLGYTTKFITQIKSLTKIIPGVGDLINMAVKEAFNPDIVEKFGYDQEIPDVMIEWAEKQGLSREWAEYFWFAHWVVPSVGQGFEMLHRLRPGTTKTPFTDVDMKELMKTLDIPTYWRERLIQVSYNPLTRVDVRRMHDMGILDKDGVKSAYLDAGYNDENADLMTEFTLRFNQDAEKNLSKQIVLKAYKKGLFTESEAHEIIMTSGYSSEQASFYISVADYEELERQTDLETDIIEERFSTGEINKTSAHSELNALALPEEQIQQLLRTWELSRLKKVRLPSETELEKFYQLDYISAEDYRQGLLDKNYKLETIDWFIRQADQTISEKAFKAEQDAIEANERLQRESLVDDYRIDRSKLDVMIASRKADIAELKLLAHDIEDSETLEELKEQIDLIKLIIAERQLEKAQLKLAVEEELEEEE